MGFSAGRETVNFGSSNTVQQLKKEQMDPGKMEEAGRGERARFSVKTAAPITATLTSSSADCEELGQGYVAPGHDLKALVAGSGPGLYVLPSTIGFVNHDCTRVAGPAYSLSRRPSEVSPQETSPGPVYFLDPKVTRFGRSCTPAYSMQGRGKSRGLEVTPGPGAYSPEKVAPVRQRTPPAFTLGSRLRPQPMDNSTPAPNTYTLPSLWGSQISIKPSSPSYTVVGRMPAARPPQDPAEMPGPGQRPRAPRPQEETPGPGTHSPEQVTVTKARAPAFTMGIRHSKRATTMAADTTA
nr:PREDICTED: LOW QUALITY PROTEIN: outer dense fiber protein 3-like protein 2 [Camelus bactrianus]